MPTLADVKQYNLRLAFDAELSPHRLDKREMMVLMTSQGFAPETPGDWSTVPTTLDGALNTLAASISAGSVLSVNGETGVVVLDKADIGLGNVDNTSDAAKPISTATQAALNGKQATISAASNHFIYSNSSSDIVAHPNLFRNTTSGGTDQTLTMEPDDGGYVSLNTNQINIEPTENSPDQVYAYNQTNINIDNDDSGFSFGINNSNAVMVQTNGVNHLGTGDSGGIQFLTNNVSLGNGTDSIDVAGFGYAFGFGTINANVNISGPMQGYGFQPQFNASATTTPDDAYVNAFYDGFTASGTTVGFYNSFTSAPTIGAIANNKNYTGINVNPNITTFTGNAGATAINVGGTYGTFGTGSWFGINVNPATITSAAYATGLYINMTNATATDVKAIDVVGDVSINGNLSFTGGLSIGQLNAFYSDNPVNGGGNPLVLHGLTSQMIALDSTTVANADAIGVNTAMLIELEDNSVTTSGAFKLGFAALAMPCVVKTGTGSSLDYMNMAAYALNLDATSTGGTIDRINGVRVEAIPNGVTTINEFVAFEFDQSFGQVGTDVWGLHVVPTFAQNFIGGSLAIGTSTEKVTNSSTALEIGGTTRAFLNARMTSTERDALTAVDGMQIYNVTTSKLQVRAGGSWVDLH